MKKILIIKMSALGDIMIALPHIEAILRHHRSDRIHLLTGPAYTDLFTNNPALQVIVLDRRHRLSANSAWARIIWVRHQRFDRIYDLQGNRTSRLVVRFSGAGERVGTQPRSVYTHHPPREYTRDTRQNVFDRLNETLAAGGLAPAIPGSGLYFGKQQRREVERWKQQNNLRETTYVLLHAGGSRDWPSKRWPEHSYAELATLLSARGVACVWVGGPDEQELNARLAAVTGFDATGLFSPLQLALLGRGACCAVTNDSGPMHILCAAGIPVFAFFGPTDWRRSHGAGQAERILTRAVACSPCFKGVCPADQNHACLAPISPEEVFKRLSSELQIFKTEKVVNNHGG